LPLIKPLIPLIFNDLLLQTKRGTMPLFKLFLFTRAQNLHSVTWSFATFFMGRVFFAKFAKF